MKAYFQDHGVSVEVETDLDHQQLHTLWVCSTRHGCHVQIPVKVGSKAVLLNVRSMDTVHTFDGILLPSTTIPPPRPP